MSKKKITTLILSVALSIFLIWYLLSRIEIEDLLETFSNIYYPALFTFMAISLSAAGLRAWRYKLLLHPHFISSRNILLVTFIRNLFVDLFPARIGSLSFIYVLNKSFHFPFESATSTFVVGFVFDFLTISPFLALSILSVGLGSTNVSSYYLLGISVIFFIIVCLILWKMIQLSRFFLKTYLIFVRILKIKEKKWAKLIEEKIRLTIDTLVQTNQRRIFWPIFFLSFGIRLAKYGSLFFLLFALLRSHGFSLESLSFWKIILGITGAELTGALPIKGIGGFGTWEFGWALTFQLMNVETRIAILSGIGVHLITNLFEYSLGIISILFLSLPLARNLTKKK